MVLKTLTNYNAVNCGNNNDKQAKISYYCFHLTPEQPTKVISNNVSLLVEKIKCKTEEDLLSY